MQGEDVVAGIRTPEDLDTMKQCMPGAYEELVENCNILEKHYRDMMVCVLDSWKHSSSFLSIFYFYHRKIIIWQHLMPYLLSKMAKKCRSSLEWYIFHILSLFVSMMTGHWIYCSREQTLDAAMPVRKAHWERSCEDCSGFGQWRPCWYFVCYKDGRTRASRSTSPSSGSRKSIAIHWLI